MQYEEFFNLLPLLVCEISNKTLYRSKELVGNQMSKAISLLQVWTASCSWNNNTLCGAKDKTEMIPDLLLW